jgi:hypothetical protein
MGEYFDLCPYKLIPFCIDSLQIIRICITFIKQAYFCKKKDTEVAESVGQQMGKLVHTQCTRLKENVVIDCTNKNV